ncbi:Lnb N-terminal periplasmic domain-containing protein [Fodinibius sp. SL11]|uniref:Lnb N-terminal periplasmic domain-containing protein n=1 Tax=Fodinibius sp. SL11 TaxID=3425690 RepID=UPI003F884C60
MVWAIANATVSKAQSISLSADSQVSLITAAPGDQLYSLFGHTALRIYDPKTGIDRTYNYGTFDFDAEGFYWKFALGNLRYFLSTTTFENAKKAYLRDGRIITEQRLNLSPEQTQQLFRYLQTNARPENRYYSYKFFYDNCTTRVYEALNAVIGDSLWFKKPLNPAKNSFRQFINPYLEPAPWVKLGVNLVLGLPADEIPSGSETLFLPNFLKKRFANAKIQNGDNSVALVDNQAIYTPSNKAALNPPLLTPNLVFWSLFVLVIPLGIAFPNKQSLWRWFDRVLFGIVGGIGFLILILWLFSIYPATTWNANIVWTLIGPIILYVVIYKRKHHPQTWKLIELVTLGIILIALTFFLIHQGIPPTIYPVLVLLIFRGWIYFLMSRPKYATILEINQN